VYDTRAGDGTYGYVVDSGINLEHNDFGGRASNGYNAVGGNFGDTLGHGTHVAGIMGGTTFGVAKLTSLIAVKVFQSGSTTTSVILDGYAWAVNDIVTKNRTTIAAINMSLGGGFSEIMNDAISSAFNEGVVTVVAAGNEADEAKKYSPASAAGAITVGAIDSTWRMAAYSNYGDAVDLFAPGSGITSTWIGSASATATLSGTSMASPHVAGLVLYLQSVERLCKPSEIAERLVALATTGKITQLGAGSPNTIAYNGVETYS
jgi:oryzin